VSNMITAGFCMDPHLHEAWKTSVAQSPWIAPKWRVVASRAPKGRASKVGSQHPFFFFET
jgi:hypothetical protein